MSASQNQPIKIVIVGGVAGGASAAARARRLSEKAEIVLIERGPDPSFANCGMPYYIGGEIEQRESLLVSPVARLRERYRLDVRTRQSVESIDRQQKTVTIRDLTKDKVYEESYDKLILSPGASPFRPPIPGVDLPGIHTLRNLEDADHLHAAAGASKRAVIVGGGFIGLEMAENLVRRGIETTVLEYGPQVLGPWDPEMAAPIADQLRKHGVDLRLGTSAAGFEKVDDGIDVTLSTGEKVTAGFVVMSVGVRPENNLATDAGLEVGERGGIRVTRNMLTGDPDIYAVGDAVETYDSNTDAPTQVPLAGPANRQGRIAADHIFGLDSSYRGTQGTAVVGLFGMTAAMTGLSEKACERVGVNYEKIYIHANHHAGYFPGAEPLALKLLFDPESGRVLGAQATGGAGVDKRIDVLAMAVQAKMTVFDLEESELCYAPQFGSAKDPVNMAGFVAANVLRGDHPLAHSDNLQERVEQGAIILDVRTPGEFAAGAIPGAINFPLDDLRERLAEIPKDSSVVAYCKVGMRGYMATRILQHSGYNARNLSGGFTTYAQVMASQAM